MTINEVSAKYSNIPDEMKSSRLWVNWAGKDKIPKSPHTGWNAKSNDPATWGTFDEAVNACVRYNFGGIGFMLSAPFFGIDLDHCIDRADFCDEFVETLQSYNEFSMSGEGLHIICRGELPDGARRRGGVEMYQGGRYFAMTGNVYNTNYLNVADCTESVKVLHQKYLPALSPAAAVSVSDAVGTLSDDDVIEKARNCKTGERFRVLYYGDWRELDDGGNWSHSEADLSLCNQLAFWCGRNKEQMDRLFRASALMRDKWDQMRGSRTYGQITIDNACASCREVFDPAKYDDDGALAVAFFGRTSSTVSGASKIYDKTDSGNALRLFDKFGNVLRYSHNRKKWYIWNGKQWLLDEMGEIKKMADAVINDMKEEALLIDDDKMKKDALKFAHRTASHSCKEAMIKECQHLAGIPVSMDELDPAGDYLNCVNGIVNLKNGELLPHDSSLMMTKMCGAEYDENHGTPSRWLAFLDDVTNGDAALVDYIQRCVGYSLTGSGQEQCAYFLYGIGNNGKSTFLDTIADLLGTYACNAQPDTLMMSGRGNGNGANSDIARLKSARFVTCEEPTEGVRLNEGLLKQLTGGGKITARFLYGDEFEFRPEFAAWIATNHKPVIRGTDVGIWRRIKLIPFEVNIPAEKVDKKLKYKLRDEFPQILAWAVDGCIKWHESGLNEPAAVTTATKEYKAEMDLVACFVEQCLTIDYEATERIMASDMYQVFSGWGKANGEYVMSSKKLGMELAKKVPERGRNSHGNYYGKVVFTDYAKTFLVRNYSAAQFS